MDFGTPTHDHGENPYKRGFAASSVVKKTTKKDADAKKTAQERKKIRDRKRWLPAD